MKTLLFKNGDQIILRDTGNTYVGEYAHLAMSAYYKMLRKHKLEDSSSLQIAFYNEMIKQILVSTQ